MAAPLVVELLVDGRLATIKQNSLLVVQNVGGVWTVQKPSPSLTVVGANVVVVDAGWYGSAKGTGGITYANYTSGSLIALSGGGGVVRAVTGPWP